ncbi:MAG TPA: hypothetical protein IAB53_01990 [Candidatus Scybalocola faecipullorum]|nr:hypothetical protein [Candidatus Scybalocola faecipullorum]
MKEERRRTRASKVIFTVIALLCIFICAVVLYFFSNDGRFEEGIFGFIRDVIFRLIGAAAVAVAVWGLVRHLQRIGEKRWQTALYRLLAVLLVCAGVAGIFFLMRAPILDVPYLNQPEINYLRSIIFDWDSTGDSSFYSIRGMDRYGRYHSYTLDYNTYTKAEAMHEENKGLIVKVSYLPHTNVVMELTLLEGLDDQAKALLDVSGDLPHDWKQFQIQIMGEVYRVPSKMSEFERAGWAYKDPSEADVILGARENPENTLTTWEHIDMVNENGQEITVTAINTTDQNLPARLCTAGIIDVDCSGLDFEGFDVILPGNIVLGWSAKTDVLDAYGEPTEQRNGDFGTMVYKMPGVEFFHEMTLEFDDMGILYRIEIQNEDL